MMIISFSTIQTTQQKINIPLHCSAFAQPLLSWKCMNMLPFYCCWRNCSCLQYKVFSSVMDVQQWVTLALFSSCKIFRTVVCVNNNTTRHPLRLSTRQTSTTVTSKKGLYMQPQTHTDCTTDCNSDKSLFCFIVKTTIF
jgi:hypothetical protein